MTVTISKVQLNPTNSTAIRAVISGDAGELATFTSATIFVSDQTHGSSSGFSKMVNLGSGSPDSVFVDFEAQDSQLNNNFTVGDSYGISGVLVGGGGNVVIPSVTVDSYDLAPVQDTDYSFAVSSETTGDVRISIRITTLIPNAPTNNRITGYHITITHFDKTSNNVVGITSIFKTKAEANSIIDIKNKSITGFDIVEGNNYEVSIFAEGSGGQTLSTVSKIVTVDDRPDPMTLTSYTIPTSYHNNDVPDYATAVVELTNNVPGGGATFDKIKFTFTPSSGDALTRTIAYSQGGALNKQDGVDTFTFSSDPNDPNDANDAIFVPFKDSETYTLTTKVNNVAYLTSTTNERWSSDSSSGDLTMEAKPTFSDGRDDMTYDMTYDGTKQFINMTGVTTTNPGRFHANSGTRLVNIRLYDGTNTISNEETNFGEYSFSEDDDAMTNGNFGYIQFNNSSFTENSTYVLQFDVNYSYNKVIKTLSVQYGTINGSNVTKGYVPKYKYYTPNSLSFDTQAAAAVTTNGNGNDLILDDLLFTPSFTAAWDQWTQNVESVRIDLFALDESDNITGSSLASVSGNENTLPTDWKMSKSATDGVLNRTHLGVNLKAQVTVSTYGNNKLGNASPADGTPVSTGIFQLADKSGLQPELVSEGSTRTIKFKPSGLLISDVFLYRKQMYAHYTSSFNGESNFSDQVAGSTDFTSWNIPEEFVTKYPVGINTSITNNATVKTKIIIVYSSVMNVNTQGIITLTSLPHFA